MAKVNKSQMTILNKVVQKAQDADSSKADLLEMLKNFSDTNDEFNEVAGTISEDDIVNVRVIENANLGNDVDVDYIKKDDTIMVHKVDKSKKIVDLYVKEPSREEARYFTDLYYQFQRIRINMANQIRAIDQGKDQDDKDHKDDIQRLNKNMISTPAAMAFRHHLLKQIETIENDIKACLSEYSDRMPFGKYAKATVGIGPVFATLICSELDIPDKKDLPENAQVFTSGNWVSYAGLNDNNRPWIKNDALAKKYVEEAIAENGGIIDDDAVRLLCAKTQWTYDHYYKFCCDKKTGKFKGFTKEALVKGSKMIPYNKNLKKTMYLIGQSFIKVQNNPESLYGKLYKTRLQYEIDRNEAGGNAEAAAKALSEKNWNTSTLAYKAYKQGKLPKAQLSMRAQRVVEKIFLEHLFEFLYLEKFGELAPVPYIFKVEEGHKDYIGPEVDFKDFLTNEKAIKLLESQNQ